MSRMKLGLVALLVIAVAVVVLQNTETVETRILVAKIEMPRALLISVAFLVGVACGLLLATRFGGGKKRPEA